MPPRFDPRRGNGPRLRPALAATWFLLAATGIAAAATAPATPDSATARPTYRTSTQGSPGWYPSIDPESAAVRLGRRPNAPIVSMPFQGGLASLDDLGRTVCRLLAHDDFDSLMAICVADSEFREIMWNEFPNSRPATGLTWLDGWRVLGMRLQGGCHDAVGEFGGHYWQFLRWEVGQPLDRYRNFDLHSGLVMVVRNESGEVQKFDWLRSVVERKGRFKIYSVRD